MKKHKKSIDDFKSAEIKNPQSVKGGTGSIIIDDTVMQ